MGSQMEYEALMGIAQDIQILNAHMMMATATLVKNQPQG